jgi:dTDP-4-dehydrorhamnose reductase
MRLLVTGLSGYLGYALGKILANAYEVVATFHEKRPEAFGGRLVRVDLADQEAVAGALSVANPQAVIHMAAISQPNLCETDLKRTAAVNVDASASIARWCASHHCSLVFTSTDLIFDGTAAPYGETDAPNPLNAYARQKVAAEGAILARHPRAVICRMPLMFGYGGPDGKKFTHEMVNTIALRRPVRLFTDEFRTPLSTVCAATALLRALDWPGGIYHLGGPERVSRFELGRRIAAHLGVGTAHLQPLTQDAMPMVAPRAADVSLGNRKARAVGFAPAGLDEAIGRMLMAYGLKKE